MQRAMESINNSVDKMAIEIFTQLKRRTTDSRRNCCNSKIGIMGNESGHRLVNPAVNHVSRMGRSIIMVLISLGLVEIQKPSERMETESRATRNQIG